MPLTISCAQCGRPATIKPLQARLYRLNYCSRQCRGAHLIVEAMQRWEARLGEPLIPWLKKTYDDGASYRTIMANLGLNETWTLSKVMRLNGIRIRKGSDAVKTQWLNADERRDAAARNMKRIAVPLGHFAHGKNRSPREIVVQRWIEDAGLIVAPQRKTRTGRPGCQYHIDLFLPDLNVGVEIYGSKSLLRPLRHREIEKLGVRMLYVPNRIVDRNERFRIDKLIACLKRARLAPSPAEETELVRWGYPEGAPAFKADLDQR